MVKKDPGWCDDPSVSDRFRWWDGSGWTSWVATTRDAPPPPRPARRVTPVPTEVDVWMRRLGLVLVAGLVMFAIVAGIGVAINRRESAGRALPPLPSGPVPTASKVNARLMLSGGDVVSDSLFTIPMPGGDFDPAESLRMDDGLFSDRYRAYLPGSEVPDGGPGAQIHAGLATDGLMHAQYAGANAALAATQVAHLVFDPVDPVISQAEVVESTIAGRKAWEARVQVTFRDGEREHRAEVTALVVQLDQWQWLLWSGATTERMTQNQRRAMQASKDGIAFVP